MHHYQRDHLLDGASTPPLPRSIQSCPAGQRQNTQETAPSKTKDLSAQFLERGVPFGCGFAALCLGAGLSQRSQDFFFDGAFCVLPPAGSAGFPEVAADCLAI